MRFALLSRSWGDITCCSVSVTHSNIHHKWSLRYPISTKITLIKVSLFIATALLQSSLAAVGNNDPSWGINGFLQNPLLYLFLLISAVDLLELMIKCLFALARANSGSLNLPQSISQVLDMVISTFWAQAI